MYAAFWLDPNAKDPNKRVVVCQPFTKKPTTAWAILRSAIREHRTGGVIAGPEDNLRNCVEKIDQKDQGWPDDADRMVAQITKLANSVECSVIFKQNIEPDGMAEQASVWAALNVGAPQIDSEGELRSTVRIPITGSSLAIETAEQIAKLGGWSTNDQGFSKELRGARVTFRRMRTIETRAALEIEYVTAASKLSKQNSAGYSEEFKLGFERVNDMLDCMLGPTAKKHKFVLLIREHNNSIVFLGNKTAHTTRQAIEQYVDHLVDRASTNVPRSSQPVDEQDSSFLDEIVAPAVSNCRFWKL